MKLFQIVIFQAKNDNDNIIKHDINNRYKQFAKKSKIKKLKII